MGDGVIHGIGTDLVEVARFRRLLERFDTRLAERMLHETEWRRLESDADPARWLSKCFAAKEATVKALGTGFRGIYYRDVGLTANALRRPDLVFSARGREKLAEHGVQRWHVNLSDDAGLVVAFVVLEGG